LVAVRIIPLPAVTHQLQSILFHVAGPAASSPGGPCDVLHLAGGDFSGREALWWVILA
jgi:hypothetical protein